MSRSRVAKRGKPRALLAPHVHERLVEATKSGNPVQIAAQYAGVSPRAFMMWMARGRDEQWRRDDGEEPNADEQMFVDLMTAVEDARSHAAVSNVLNIQRVARGGIVTKETTRKYRDDDGNLVEETEITRTPPDWRASAWMLERQFRDHFGKTDAVEVTGAGGGPVQLSVEKAESLADRIAENMAAIAAARPVALEASPADPDADGDEQIAELVEDGQ